MIKDAIVNLTVGASRDVTADYAVWLAAAFGAHLSGIGFTYEAVVPGTVFGGVGADLIQAQREASLEATRTVVDSFEGGSLRPASRRKRMCSRQARWPPPTPSAGWRGVSISRSWPRPSRTGPPSRELIIEAVLFEFGRPVLIVPYIQKEGLKLDKYELGAPGRQPQRRPCGRATPCRFWRAPRAGGDRGRHRRCRQE